MAINKVVFGNNTLIDITSTTALASDVASGKIFFTKDGVQTTGTSTGGGGLVYETGTYTPTTDIARPEISFATTHSVPPAILIIYDCTETDYPDTNTNVAMNFIDMYRLFGSKYMYNSNTSVYRYATIQYLYRGTTLTSVSSGTIHFSYNSDNTKDTSTSYSRYFVGTSSFRPYTNSTSRYWRKDRTYKWIAIWK